MRWTTIDKDDPATWPPDSNALVVVVYADEWRGGEVISGRNLAASVHEAPNLWHGDRWAILPGLDDEPEAEPEDDGRVERRIVLVETAHGWSACGGSWCRDEADALSEALEGVEYMPHRAYTVVARVLPYAEPEAEVVAGVCDE